MTEEQWLLIFTDRLREMLDSKNMTQRELANRTDINEKAISKYITGNKTPSIKVLLKMCDALECTMDKLVV